MKVVVKVIAAGVNLVDTYIRSGGFYTVPELPFTLGKDGAGIVPELGAGVTNFKVCKLDASNYFSEISVNYLVAT
ncbi:hypothetical protein TNCV_2663852 [Trichonephila clavipes]|nr:hypothetical protein TNCV_2663852 [Trichonephila clavipes]